jgi:hypothetical protein
MVVLLSRGVVGIIEVGVRVMCVPWGRIGRIDVLHE